MKRLFTIITLALLVSGVAQAQETTTAYKDNVMYLDSEGNSAISSNNGNLSVMLNGSRFEIGNGKIEHIDKQATKKPQRAYFGFMGLDSPSFNHIAWFEIGANTFVQTDYSMYSPEDANALMFSSTKSINYSFNVGTLNVPLNPSRSLVFSMAYGFTLEDYAFNSNNTFKYIDGMMRPVPLDGNIKKSKFSTSYFHIPMMLDWNIKHNFFVAAGVNLDILMATSTRYKFPRTTVQDRVTVNPIQVGATARIGWKRLYGYVNYSFVDLFREGTGPKGKRLSAGVGIWF
jgi:hypothetical protein